MMVSSKLYINDLLSVTSQIQNIENLKNKSFFITGSCGLICSAIIDFLIILNDKYNYNIKIYAATRSYDEINKRFKNYLYRNDFVFVKYDALRPLEFSDNVDYIIHGASNATPEMYVSKPVETMLINFNGLKNLLDYAKEKKAKRVLYISSSEVYGEKKSNYAYKENDYGFLDILKPRSSYSSSKRASETLAISYTKEYFVDTVIVRPGHIYGPTATPNDNRAATQFARDVINGKDIIMRSEGKQLRSHCYVVDCVSAIITVLLNGETGMAYNISNINSVSSIKEIAESYAKNGNKQVFIKIPNNLDKNIYNPMTNSSLDSTKLESLNWKGLFDLETGTDHTLKIMKDIL